MVEEAKLMSQHARKKKIDVDDVRLGCAMLRERSWARPPARLILSQLAQSRNKHALPVPSLKLGLRLPPDRFSLTATNFRSDQAQFSLQTKSPITLETKTITQKRHISP